MKKIFIGIDFSKEKFDATLIQAEGLKECAPSVHEVFYNKTSDYRRLVKWVKAHAEGFAADTWLFCGENTGGYRDGRGRVSDTPRLEVIFGSRSKGNHMFYLEMKRISL